MTILKQRFEYFKNKNKLRKNAPVFLSTVKLIFSDLCVNFSYASPTDPPLFAVLAISNIISCTVRFVTEDFNLTSPSGTVMTIGILQLRGATDVTRFTVTYLLCHMFALAFIYVYQSIAEQELRQRLRP